MKWGWLLRLLLCSAALHAQIAIPSGTILPLQLDSSLNSKKSKAGQVITAHIAQDVPLASGSKIPVHSKLTGHIAEVTPGGNGAGARLVFQFDRLEAKGQQLPVVTSLRALASTMEVNDAQLPSRTSDRATPVTSWVTVQIGGEANYRGGGPVMRGSQEVGKSVFSGGVLVTPSSRPGSICSGESDNGQPQALWLFASDACGTYGFPGLAIAHTGWTEPRGQVVLTSDEKDIDVSRGSGLLLRVISSGVESNAAPSSR